MGISSITALRVPQQEQSEQRQQEQRDALVRVHICLSLLKMAGREGHEAVNLPSQLRVVNRLTPIHLEKWRSLFLAALVLPVGYITTVPDPESHSGLVPLNLAGQALPGFCENVCRINRLV